MMSHLTCEAFARTLPDFLERDVAEPTRAAMESHALECKECGSLLADLRKLRIDAANLPELTPSRDLWSGISARIDAPVIFIGTKQAGRGTGRISALPRWIPMTAAAAALIAVTATTTYYLTRANDRPVLAVAPSPTVVTQSAPPVIAIAPPTSAPIPAREPAVGRSALRGSQAPTRLVSAMPTAERVYDNEITRLRTIIERRRAQLDPVTISVIERNLRVIDDAIAQCRDALAKDPASRFLIESLNKALENKVELLRTAAMLPSRT